VCNRIGGQCQRETSVKSATYEEPAGIGTGKRASRLERGAKPCSGINIFLGTFLCYKSSRLCDAEEKTPCGNRLEKRMDSMLNTLMALAAVCGILCLVFLFIAVFALRKKAFFNSALSLLVAFLSLSLAALFGTLMVASRGYQALTHEVLAAVVRVEPRPKKTFTAHVRFPDQRQAIFDLAGDQLYIDAYILKWKPLINVLGLHTVYELDRIGGRYLSLDDEQTEPRRFFQLSKPKTIDLLNLRERYLFLRWLLDAEYGSATFIPSDRPATYEIRISTTGLLAREVEQKQPRSKE